MLLDHLEDPQNFGSLLRTADAAGVDGVLIPADRAVGVTPAVVRASAGASEHMRVAVVVNLARAMQALQEQGFSLVGLDLAEASVPYTQADLGGALGLVIGGEGRGLGRLVRENCDRLIRIPMLGGVASLNASVAGAVALYEALRQREQLPSR
jgi:23S rRNA (guanosine2251-2'-O)-methyltransferase